MSSGSKSSKDVKEIDLRNNKLIGKKVEKKYDLNDEELKVITLDNDIVIKLISNNRGVFVDVRKYYKGYPTKKGIRVIASRFREVARILDDDIRKLIPDSDLNELNSI